MWQRVKCCQAKTELEVAGALETAISLTCHLDSASAFHSFQDLRRKAARLVAAKCTLAARVDSFHESTEGKVRDGQASVCVGQWSLT